MKKPPQFPGAAKPQGIQENRYACKMFRLFQFTAKGLFCLLMNKNGFYVKKD